jgi:hypothetical protein
MVSGVVAIGMMFYLVSVMIDNKCKGTESNGWIQWMMAVFFSMKSQPTLTSKCVFECFQVAIIVVIGHSSELELVLSKNNKSSQS